MQPTYVTFADKPASTANAVLRIERGSPSGGYLALGADGLVEMTFDVPEADARQEATLHVVALVSKLGGSAGFAPLDITVNDRCLVHDWRIPGGGDLPQHMDFAVPAGRLRPGANTLRLASSADARSMLWLYQITVDEVFDRGRSARAIDRRAAEQPVLRYATRLAPAEGGRWEPGPDVLAYVDRGEQSPLAQLAWADTSGAEYAVTFTAELDEIYGWCRPAGAASPYEFRGSLTGRWPADHPEAGAARQRWFATEEGWGGGWHASDGITFGIGSTPLTRANWRDKRGNSGTVAFTGNGFLGTYQRVGEGAIGYRGHSPATAKVVAPRR
jgi:OAA-family lectin sugar binding domain